MFAAETGLKYAQRVKDYLLQNDLLHPEYLLVKEFDALYFPLRKKVKVPHARVVNTKFSFPRKETKRTVDDLVKGKLTATELKLIPRSQEIIGSILVLEIPPKLRSKEKLIAEAYRSVLPRIETVVKKEEIHSGEYRLRKVKHLAGKRTTETIHHENGIMLKLDLEKTYFSARLGNERLRIAKQVKSGENVLVLFSGVAPYPLVIAKNAKPASIYAIEINPLAHQYALENIALNGAKNIRVLVGDVRALLPEIHQKFERIVVPLPKTGELFLDFALKKAKKGTIIHLYVFLRDTEVRAYIQKIKSLCTRYAHPVRVLRTVKCGQFSPGVFRVCFDLRIEK